MLLQYLKINDDLSLSKSLHGWTWNQNMKIFMSRKGQEFEFFTKSWLNQSKKRVNIVNIRSLNSEINNIIDGKTNSLNKNNEKALSCCTNIKVNVKKEEKTFEVKFV